MNNNKKRKNLDYNNNSDINKQDLQNKSYKDLQNLAKSLSLKASGKKEVLIERIYNYLLENQNQNENNSQDGNEENIIESSNNNSLVGGSDKFKNEYEFDKSTHNEIKKYSKSLGLASAGTKKELYDRIIYYLDSKKLILEASEKNNFNAFNKDREKLKIIEGLDAVELPFWNVFRNKSIFKLIFSNFKWSMVKSYDDLINFNDILKYYSNAVEIIKDKVKSGRIHIFNNNDVVLNVFALIRKDSKENREFYSQLFKSYSPNNNNNQFNKINKWFKNIVSTKNITALSQYISQFNIHSSIIINNFQTFNSIGGSYQGIKLFNYLKLNGYLNIKKCDRFRLTTEFLQDESLKFKQLIKSFKIIISNYNNYYNIINTSNNEQNNSNHYSNNNNNNNNINFNNKDKYNNILKELSNIELNQFTKQQLNSTIQQLIIDSNKNSNNCNNINNNNYNNNLKIIIYKYFKIFHSIIKYLNNLNNNNNNIHISKSRYYLFFKNQKAKEMIGFDSISNLKQQYEFVYCISTESKKEYIEFIKNKYPYSMKHIFEFIVSTSDLELIQFLIDDFSIQREYIYKPSNSLFLIVNSVEVLDYFYKLSKLSIFRENLKVDWTKFNNFKILEHHEKYMIKSQLKFLFTKGGCSFYRNPQILFRAYNNEEISYLYEKNPNFEVLPQTYMKVLEYYIRINKAELIFQLFRLNKCQIFSFSRNEKHNYLILDWFLQYFTNDDFINILCNAPNKQEQCVLLCLSKNSDDGKIISCWGFNEKEFKKCKSFAIRFESKYNIFKILFQSGRTETALELFKQIPEYMTTKEIEIIFQQSIFPTHTIDSIIKFGIENLKKEQLDKSICFYSLKNAARNGYIECFERIIFKYPNIFKRRAKGLGLFSPKNLIKIVKESKSHFQLFEFLLVNVSLSNIELRELTRDYDDGEEEEEDFDW